MSAKHTPGPWTVHGDSQTLIGADDGKMMLASAFHKHAVCEWQRTQAEAQSNARLIAAAPELLQALTALLAHSANVNTAFYVHGNSKAMRAAMDGQKQLLDQARAAIAKATA